MSPVPVVVRIESVDFRRLPVSALPEPRSGRSLFPSCVRLRDRETDILASIFDGIGRDSVGSDQGDQAAEDSNVCRGRAADMPGFLGLQTDSILLFVESLESNGFIHHGHHDLPVFCRTLMRENSDIAVHNTGSGHAVAFNPQRENLASSHHRSRKGQSPLMMLFQRRAGHRQRHARSVGHGPDPDFRLSLWSMISMARDRLLSQDIRDFFSRALT